LEEKGEKGKESGSKTIKEKASRGRTCRKGVRAWENTAVRDKQGKKVPAETKNGQQRGTKNSLYEKGKKKRGILTTPLGGGERKGWFFGSSAIFVGEGGKGYVHRDPSKKKKRIEKRGGVLQL